MPRPAPHAYNTAGRLTSETRPDGRVIAYQRDAAGNVTRLTWPEEAGDGYAATYVHDALDRVTGVYEGAGTGGPQLGGYVYDTASRRRSLDRHTGAVTRWAWRPDGLVQDLEHSFATGTPVSFTYLYNREGGVSARLLNDASYQATPALQAETPYTANALNQYTAVGAASLSYDANGNLIGDGAVTYRYDAQNRLVGFTVGSVVVSYGYDAEGRRSSRTEGGTTTRSLFALGQEIAEYAGSALVARHVPGPGLNEPPGDGDGRAGAGARPKTVPRRTNTQSFITTMEGGTLVLGTVELQGRRLSLAASSLARVERGGRCPRRCWRCSRPSSWRSGSRASASTR